MKRLTEWLAKMPSTNVTIATGLCLSVLYVLWALASDSFGKPLSETTLDAVGLFVVGLVTGGVVQFSAKRATQHKPGEANGTDGKPSDASSP